MKNQDQSESHGTEKVRVSRRRLLSAIALGGGAAAVLPERWVKPVVDAVLLPAHAQATMVQNFGLYSNQNGNNVQGRLSTGLLDRMAGFLVGTAAAGAAPGDCTNPNTLPNTFCVSLDVPPPPGANVAIAFYDDHLGQFLTGIGELIDVNEIRDVMIGKAPYQASFSNLSVEADELTGFMVYPLGNNAIAQCYELALPRTDGVPCAPPWNTTSFTT